MDAATERDPQVIAGDRRRTHDDIDARARRAAAGLVAGGIGKGDVVALLLRNDFAVFEAQGAAAILGAVAVALDAGLSAEDALFILDDCAARLLIVHADLLAPLRGRLPQGVDVIIVAVPPDDPRSGDDGAPAGGDLWEPWLARHAPHEGQPAADVPTLAYTSGSSGRPKAVRRSGGPRSPGSAKALRVYGFDKPGRAVALVTGPLSHAVPRALAKLAMGAGADVVLMPRFDAEHALALIARHRVTHVHLSPAMMLRLLRCPARERHAAGSLRHVVHGAAHCPPFLKAEAITAWGPIVHEYYGSTETGLLTMADSADAAARPGTVGRALPGVTLAVLDDEGRPMPAGTTGRIYAGSAGLHAFTYPGREAERAAIGRGDLVTAGDDGHLDGDGYLFLRDRGRDIIQIGAETIVPAAVEAAILAIPGVADCAALGLDRGDGTVVWACIELLPGAEPLPGAIEAALARATRARSRAVILDRLPRADTGKVFKQRLREQLAKLDR